MATKIELTIAPNYVPGWGIVEAIRELFQNALDQETQCPGNEMNWEYDGDEEVLRISNKESVLTANTLLLGQTTKAKDVSTIGQFGEGYKIATLVLLRNNKQITFYNYGAKEIWRPRFVKSRRFGTDVLTFFIEKTSVWKTVPDANLTIEVSGITRSEWENEIVPSNLHLQYGVETIETTQYGDVIDRPGKVFVNGLYVCDYEPYKYGYNFKPEWIDLDRDRKMVSDFDLRWCASRIWSASENTEKVMELIEANHADVSYITSMGTSHRFSDAAYHRFRDAYGPEAVPVFSQSELEEVPEGYKGIIVADSYKALVRSSSLYTAPRVYIKTTREKLEEWVEKIAEKYQLTDDELEEFNSIVEDV